LITFNVLPAVAQSVEDFDTRYAAALQSFKSAEYDEARAQFQALLQSPDLRPSFSDNCYFWMGESYYAQKSWLDAATCFFKVLEYPRSNKEEDARMKIALCWFNLGDRARACTESQSLLTQFPYTHFARRAHQLVELSCPKN
jgi:TolA-binding protein